MLRELWRRHLSAVRAVHPAIESLEERRLLATTPLALKINFQPAGSPVPAGYLLDSGNNYGPRGNGQTYGWRWDNTANARDRNAPLSPDQRYDTLNHMQRGTNNVWAIAVPSGSYDVRVVAGDPSAVDSVYRILAEGVQILSGTPTSGQPWFDGSARVTVGDGALTITNASGAVNNKIDFLELTRIDSPAPGGATPFGGTPVNLPGTIEAENFDNGGEGIAYHDRDSVNSLGTYRGTGVDIANSAVGSGGHIVGATYAGEWVQYTVNAPTAGTFELQARVASKGQGGRFHVAVDGVDRTGSLTIPNTGDWASYQTLTKPGVSLSAGRHVVRLIMDVNGPTTAVGNFDWLRFAASTSSAGISWQTAAPSPIPRFEAHSAAVNGKLYVFGGFFNTSIEATTRSDVYDVASNSWTRIADLPIPVTHSAVIVDGGTICLFGGFVGNDPGPSTTDVWKYSIGSNSWSRGPSLPEPRAAGAAGLLGREVHYFGGLGPGNLLTGFDQSSHFVLNLDTGGWRGAAALPNPRNHLGGGQLGGKLYAIGGQHRNGEADANQNTVSVYDPATNSWTSAAPLPLARGHIGSSTFVRNGRILVIGGAANGPSARAEVSEYNPQLNAWRPLTPIPEGRAAAVAGWVNNLLVVSTGETGGAHPQTTTWIGTTFGF